MVIWTRHKTVQVHTWTNLLSVRLDILAFLPAMIWPGTDHMAKKSQSHLMFYFRRSTGPLQNSTAPGARSVGQRRIAVSRQISTWQKVPISPGDLPGERNFLQVGGWSYKHEVIKRLLLLLLSSSLQNGQWKSKWWTPRALVSRCQSKFRLEIWSIFIPWTTSWSSDHWSCVFYYNL